MLVLEYFLGFGGEAATGNGGSLAVHARRGGGVSLVRGQGFLLFEVSFELGGVEDPTVGAAEPVEQLREGFAPGFHGEQVLGVRLEDAGDFFFGEGVCVHGFKV